VTGGSRREAIDERVHDQALVHVLDNLAPLQVLLLPLTLLIAAMMRDDIDESRLSMWVGASIVATLVVVLACIRTRRARADDAPRGSAVLVGIALCSVGAVAGSSTWAAAASDTDVVLLFALFPSVSCAVGAIVCAGRRDMYIVYAAPLAICESFGLWSNGDGRLRALAVLNLGYAVALGFLHHTVSRSLLSSLRHQMASEVVATRMAVDQAALTDAYRRLSETNAQLFHLASHDPLTGLLNRRGTLEALDAMLIADHAPTGLLFIDVDRFKSVNDLLGHRGGDRVLTVLADRITRVLHADAIAGRIGGDEFVVVLPDHDAEQTAAVASRLLGVLAQPVHIEGRSMPTSISAGVAAAPDHGTTSSDLLRNSNAALSRAKKNGRNRVEVFDGNMQQELQSLLDAEQALRRAIDGGQIVPFFQPEIDATTGRVVGAEVLARWLRDDGTMTSAADFINVARKAGLLERMTERVLAQARPDIRRMSSLGLPDGFRFRVNLAPSTTDGSWTKNAIDELVRGIDPTLITVDVREPAVVDDLPGAAAILAGFRSRGGHVCLDDFARGVSSLGLLRQLPIDEVRIDRVAIDTITAHPHDRAIVRSIISVVREIGLTVTAEGVETGAQADALIALGCIRHQGHLYGRAMSAEQFETFLVERQAEGYATSQHQLRDWSTDGLT
jgi:diguanylate cyclase (GGDEF)-like protein